MPGAVEDASLPSGSQHIHREIKEHGQVAMYPVHIFTSELTVLQGTSRSLSL